MAAAPASRLNETHSPDYFEVFGLQRRFGIDRAALERKFYALSRETHPDRFAAAGPDAVRAAMERMSLLNEGYRILKDPAELRQYFLRLEGMRPDAGTPCPGAAAATKSASVPAELAESWFELQDAVMESPEEAPARLQAFERELAALRARGSEELLAVEREIDGELAAGHPVSRERLERLSSGIRAQSYLKSMERDVERISARIGARMKGAGA